jgi:CRP-like cAMP-binding protein
MEVSCIEAEKRDRYKFLTKHPAFSKMNHELLLKTAQVLRVLHFTKNEVVYHEGDHCDQLYFVKKGEFIMKKKLT